MARGQGGASSITPSSHESAPRGDAPAVRFEGVGLRYGRAPEVLRDISLTLAPGSFHFLTGPSGAGKTSLLRLVTLASRPSRGLIGLFGHDVGSLSAGEAPELRRRIGVVWQEFRLLDHLSAFDNAALPLRVAGMRPAQYRDDVRELLDWVGLRARADALPPTLSGGEKQRLAVARAVVTRPALLVADEPTAAVDPAAAARLLKLFTELNRMGTTVLIASHDEELVRRSGAPVLELQEGRLLPAGVSA